MHVCTTRRTAGFTVVELLVALGIGLALLAVSVSAFANFRDYFALRTASQDVQLSLIDARGATLASRNDTVHGVHIESDRVIRFEGSYSAGAATNTEFPFANGVTATWSLTGGGAEVVFTRLTGVTPTSGTITLTEPRSGAVQTITVNASGSIDL